VIHCGGCVCPSNRSASPSAIRLTQRNRPAAKGTTEGLAGLIWVVMVAATGLGVFWASRSTGASLGSSDGWPIPGPPLSGWKVTGTPPAPTGHQ
jgi:hypothetical protein